MVCDILSDMEASSHFDSPWLAYSLHTHHCVVSSVNMRLVDFPAHRLRGTVVWPTCVGRLMLPA